MARRKEKVRVHEGMRFEEIPAFLSTAETAIIMHKSQGTIRKEIREGKIVAELVGSEYRIARDTLLRNTKEALSA